MINDFNNVPKGMFIGGYHESQMEECNEEIKSKDIINFSYVGTDFKVSAFKKNDIVAIAAAGGGKYDERDGSLFIIKYETKEDNILKDLQKIIDKNHETQGNGHAITADGLPTGLGDTINVEYASGEKLYKHSNQSLTVKPETAKEFYELFHSYVKKEGYDFNSAGSNVKLFDDADEDFLQGTWKGEYYGDKIEASFQKNKLTITKNGKVTDDQVEYVICNGSVKKNALKKGTTGNKPNDYEDFNGATSFSKMNWFTIICYYTENGSSFSCQLMNYDKPQPEDE